MPNQEMAGVAEPKTAADKAWQEAFDAEADSVMSELLGGIEVDGDEGEALEANTLDTSTDNVAPAEKKTPEELAELLAKANAEEDTAEDEESEEDEPAEQEDKSATAAILRMLEQEKSLRDERDAFKAEREAFEAEKQAWQEQQARADVISAEALKRVLLTDPLKLITALGVDVSRVSQHLIAAQLGDKAPEELKKSIEKAQWEARVLELEEKLQQKERLETARAETEKVRTGAAEYVTKGIIKDAPTVAAVAKVDRARVESEIFQEICNDAAARMHREPNGKPISYDEAARRVEKRWASLAAALKSQGEPAPTAGASKNDSKSGAANASNAATPSIAPSRLASKAPSTPANQYGVDVDWEQEAEIALREALAKNKPVRRATR